MLCPIMIKPFGKRFQLLYRTGIKIRSPVEFTTIGNEEKFIDETGHEL